MSATTHRNPNSVQRVDVYRVPCKGPGDLSAVQALIDRDLELGMMDAPWPPVYPKQPNEPPRVAPSRARQDEG